jgi:flagellar capping protein FliD
MNTTAGSLQTDLTDLMTTGTKSVFQKKETTQEDGTKTSEYDVDAIYNKVSSFVKDYNSVVELADDISNSSVKKATIRMINTTASNESDLAAVGITIGSDYQLKIDEDAFKQADMTSVQSLFQGSGSYGYQVATQSSTIMTQASSALTSTSTYTSSGTYSSSDLVGLLYSSES